MLVRFKNTSNVQLAPFGKISVLKGDKVVYQADFNTSESHDMVLPNSARKWSASLKDIGSFGRYKVSATFTYGEANKTIEAERYFWIVPAPIIISAGVVLVLIVLGVVLLVKRAKRHSNSSNVTRR